MRIILLLAAWIIETITLKQWFGCWLFKENFYVTVDSVSANVIHAVNEDVGLPHLLVRALHNKATEGVWMLVQTLMSYWDIRFLMGLIGLIGAVGVWYALWRLFTDKKKSRFLLGLVGIVLMLSLIEMIVRPNVVFAWRFLAIGGVFELISFVGLHAFLQKKTFARISFVLLLLAISILLLIFHPLSYQEFCLKI